MVESVGFGTLNTARFEGVANRSESALGIPLRSLPGLPGVSSRSLTAPGIFMSSHRCCQPWTSWWQPLLMLCCSPASSPPITAALTAFPTHTSLLTSAFFLLKSHLMEVNHNKLIFALPQTIQLWAFNEALMTAIPARSTGEQLNGGKCKYKMGFSWSIHKPCCWWQILVISQKEPGTSFIPPQINQCLHSQTFS